MDKTFFCNPRVLRQHKSREYPARVRPIAACGVVLWT